MSFRIGDVVVVVPEPDRRCELCGQMSETRPYGPNGERVCYECGMKNPEAVERHTKKLFAPRYFGRVPTSLCPVCANVLSAVSGVSGNDAPEPGSITVCGYCFSVLEFTADLHLQPMTPEAIEEFHREQPEAFDAMQSTVEFIKRGRALGILDTPQPPVRKH